MSSKTIVRHCSPTLAGMKTGSLFGCHFSSRQQMNESICGCNKVLVRKGLRMIPLKFENGRALIYVFRVSQLRRDLCDSTVSALLSERGYEVADMEKCIRRLMKRLEISSEFPHEIGLFLGYPPEDVSGFIENKADCCKYTGIWKVYGNVEEAKRLFRKYKKCTDVYGTMIANGKSLDSLTVSC